MGLFGRLFGKKPISEAVCDVCNGRMSSPEGYMLTTKEVVSSPKYWQRYYEIHQADFIVFRVYSYEGFCSDPVMRAFCSALVAGQKNPWLVCENCISLFDVDREKVQKYAKQWWQSGGTFKPPGTGPASSSAIKM